MELERKEDYRLAMELLSKKPDIDDVPSSVLPLPLPLPLQLPSMKNSLVSPMFCIGSSGRGRGGGGGGGCGINANDYDELPTNCSTSDTPEANGDGKSKPRRYWSQKEEQLFFEIWGRENWRLTKHGKNTIYFAQWAEELNEKFHMDIKLEEIQCKVNQTRAKFRQVKKLIETEKSNQRWKKYDIVEKILKNQYRSKNDEPVPLEALENNRDMSPADLLNTNTGSISPSPTDTIIHEVVVAGIHQNHNSEQPPNDDNVNNNNNNHDDDNDDDEDDDDDDSNLNHLSMTNSNNISLADFNSNASQNPNNNYNREIFPERIDIKAEIEEDLRKEEELISEYNNKRTNSYSLATPAYNQTNTVNNLNTYCQMETPTPAITVQQQHMHPQRFQQQYVNQLQQQRVLYANPLSHNNHFNTSSIPAQATAPTSSTANASALSSNHSVGAVTNAVTSYSNNISATETTMPAPRLTTSASIQSRKRQRTQLPSPCSNGGGAVISGGGVDSLEAQYLEEVRKKNIILQEQRDISRKRLDLEQRKLTLFEEFFPKYMNVQQQILRKINSCFNTPNTSQEPLNNQKK